LSPLRPDGWLDPHRILPSVELSPFVHHFWLLRWSLRKPYVGEALPHPIASLIVESVAGEARASIRGVHTGRLSKQLEGEGQVFGISFRPAMFQPILDASMATLTNRYVSVSEVLGDEVDCAARTIFSHTSRATRLDMAGELEGMVARAEQLVGRLLPQSTHEAARFRDLVEHMARERELLSVEQAAMLAGVNVRSLQRCFRKFVGVTPKRVIQRYRLLEAAEQLKASSPPDLAALAATLGYADQAHFTRDFTLVIGQTPRAFVRKLRH
jgi:AraC-like DNA-binding protein